VAAPPTATVNPPANAPNPASPPIAPNAAPVAAPAAPVLTARQPGVTPQLVNDNNATAGIAHSQDCRIQGSFAVMAARNLIFEHTN
jgi:hypothetical protein